MSTSESDETCGVFYLHAYLSNDRSQVLEFETLKVVKPCRDNPGLSLRVERNSGNVRQSGLYPGTQNPFRAIGVSSVSVANIADNCTQDTGACNQTAVQVNKQQIFSIITLTIFCQFSPGGMERFLMLLRSSSL